MDKKSPKFLIDQPTDIDYLDFEAYKNALIEIITSKQTPLTIGIFGEWGSGKTSLMRMVKKSLDESHTHHCNTVWFNPWKYSHEEALWRAFILTVIDSIRNSVKNFLKADKSNKLNQVMKEFEHLEENLYRPIELEDIGKWTINWTKAVQTAAKGGAQIVLPLIPGGGVLPKIKSVFGKITDEKISNIDKILHKEIKKRRLEQIHSIEQFERKFSDIMGKYMIKKNKSLVVFIDDLDRCLSSNIIEIIESIKLFLDVNGCIFLIGCNLEIIEEAIKNKYNYRNAGRLYLEKIIQLPFFLPPIEANKIASFIKNLELDLPDQRCAHVFTFGLGQNPREIKRVINIFLFLWEIAKNRKELREKISSVRLSKFVVIQQKYPELYNLLLKNPICLKDLERIFRDPKKRNNGESNQSDGISQELDQIIKSDKSCSLRNLLILFSEKSEDCNFSDLSLEELQSYIYLTYQTSIHTANTEPEAVSSPGFPFEPQMVFIESYKFEMGIDKEEADRIIEGFGLDSEAIYDETPTHEVPLNSYEIGKYPISNFEYAAFINETGYKSPSHWKHGMYPQSLSDHPVVNVSYEDAEAYCQWLSNKTGGKYRLPKEEEWEYAAKGKTKNTYPWGEWEPGKCNTKEAGCGGTTHVGQYSPKGDSPHGCADMAGNVYEWTESEYKAYPGNLDENPNFNADLRVLRGGAWAHNHVKARCTCREWRDPKIYQTKFVGFRCIREVNTEKVKKRE